MSDRRNVIYLYDGTFDGLLSAIFDCYENHEFPISIEVSKNGQQTLFYTYVHSITDSQKSERVMKKIVSVAGDRPATNIYYTYLSDINNKGLIIFNYVRACLKFGFTVNKHLTVDCVNAIVSTAQTIGGEAHLYTGFVRFSELSNGVYYSKIESKHNILPIIANHFAYRYSSMPFIIHDTLRNQCIVYNGKECTLHYTDILPHLEFSNNENDCRKLWKEFYDTIAIKERRNERCRMTHLPKHFRRFMTEFDERNNM